MALEFGYSPLGCYSVFSRNCGGLSTMNLQSPNKNTALTESETGQNLISEYSFATESPA